MWLIAYEATRKGWWPKAQSSDFITKHDYFSDLWTAKVEFYNSGKKARKQVMPSLLAKAFERGSASNVRSEEHTSELQSLMRISYAVFCLHKKKDIITILY